VVIREQLRAERPSLGRKLLDVPGYTFRSSSATSRCAGRTLARLQPQGRHGKSHRRTETRLAADDFACRSFFATEAAFRSILLLFNLLGEFQRASGFTRYRQPATLRAQVFLCGALLAGPVTAWSCICPHPGAPQTAHPPARKRVSLRRSNFAELHPEPAT